MFFWDTVYFQIFRQSVSAASCKPSAYGEHAFYVGLGCWCSYQVLGQWGKHRLPAICSRRWWHLLLAEFLRPEVHAGTAWSIWACIVAQVLALLLRLWLFANMLIQTEMTKLNRSTEMPVFSNVCNHFRFKIIFIFVSINITFVRSDFRLYFVSVLLNIFVSVNEIISISV